MKPALLAADPENADLFMMATEGQGCPIGLQRNAIMCSGAAPTALMQERMEALPGSALPATPGTALREKNAPGRSGALGDGWDAGATGRGRGTVLWGAPVASDQPFMKGLRTVLKMPPTA
jgi:hypothetical protein